ncbi:hypothetical protein [Microbacterium sp.]|uniref:hypothetical protein n=1 Tax=Microbacterium sp. TaxID=51671 RepID=UPI003F9A9D12
MSDGTQVEYKELVSHTDSGFWTRPADLNTLAENGWRLVTTVSVRDRVIDTLERPVS